MKTIHFSKHALLKTKMRNISKNTICEIVAKKNISQFEKYIIMVPLSALKKIQQYSNAEALIIVLNKNFVITSYFAHDLEYALRSDKIKGIPIVFY